MKYPEYKQQVKEKLNSIFDEVGLFFSFNQDQFSKNSKPGIDYVMIASGAIIPKENHARYIELTKQLAEWKKEAIKELDPTEVIAYELDNHEAYYTGELYDTVEAVKEFGYTAKQVSEVYDKGVK